jgi:hypothetical protein
VIEFLLAPRGTARVVELSGDFVTLLASESAPPGTPLEATFAGTSYRIKVRACRRSDEDAALPFRIEGRFQNLSRVARARLTADPE